MVHDGPDLIDIPRADCQDDRDPIRGQTRPVTIKRDRKMTFTEMAREFAEVFDELDTDQINEMLAMNVPFETLNFFAEYASEFAEGMELPEDLRGRLPNLMLMGYLLRTLEERLHPEFEE